MKLGLHSYSYRYAAGLWGYHPQTDAPMTAVHFLRKAAELSLDGVFFADPRHFESLDYGHATAVRERAEALGEYVEIGVNGTASEHLQDLVRAAHVLGSLTVRVSLDRPRPASPEETRTSLVRMAEELAQTLPLCERYGIPLTVENTPNLTSAELLSLLDLTQSEWVRVCFDTASPLVVLEDPLEAAGLLAPFTSTVHLRDLQLAASPDGITLVGCALGEGAIDLKSILDLLSARAPAISLNIKTPVSRQPVPVLEEEYLSHLPQASAVALGRVLRLARDRGLPRTPPTALERGASEEEVLAEEDDQVVRSVHWAQRALGRPEAEDLRPGE